MGRSYAVSSQMWATRVHVARRRIDSRNYLTGKKSATGADGRSAQAASRPGGDRR